MLVIVSAKSYAQKWQPGRFTDVKGNVESGFININPSGKGPIKNEGFIEFKYASFLTAKGHSSHILTVYSKLLGLPAKAAFLQSDGQLQRV